ncbi:hypothetical protein ACFYO5_10610 [Streptomyces sp. NPDC006259]|uniref:hypothetical protein n=1 Tax=Streptomyces sp. NPDC006259 TaxID=3364740 RepID=UPI0036BE1792
MRTVTFRLGDFRSPATPPHGASQTMAGVGPPSSTAATKSAAKPVELAVEDEESPLYGRPPTTSWCGAAGHVRAKRRDLPAVVGPLGPLGVKGLGKVVHVGVAPALANAVFNATGRRLRQLPLTA